MPINEIRLLFRELMSTILFQRFPSSPMNEYFFKEILSELNPEHLYTTIKHTLLIK